MSESRDTFFARYARGEVLAQDIDDYVDLWHDAAAGSLVAAQSLAAFLGLTDAEYATWVENPGALPVILSARLAGVDVAAAAANDDDEFREFRRAAQAGKVDPAQLQVWIRRHAK